MKIPSSSTSTSATGYRRRKRSHRRVTPSAGDQLRYDPRRYQYRVTAAPAGDGEVCEREVLRFREVWVSRHRSSQPRKGFDRQLWHVRRGDEEPRCIYPTSPRHDRRDHPVGVVWIVHLNDTSLSRNDSPDALPFSSGYDDAAGAVRRSPGDRRCEEGASSHGKELFRSSHSPGGSPGRYDAVQVGRTHRADLTGRLRGRRGAWQCAG
jgi:hypothetical protein